MEEIPGKMKFFLRSFLISLVALTSAVSGCAGKQFTYNQAYILSESALRDRKAKAESGNAQAAFDVYLHFMLGMRQQESPETVRWLKKAVALGHPIAKKHLEARRDNARRAAQ
jgi:hypothetical protein